MRYIEAEFDNGEGVVEYSYYEIEDAATDDDIATNMIICDDFDNFCASFAPNTDNEDILDEYFENCSWGWCEISKEEYKSIVGV